MQKNHGAETERRPGGLRLAQTYRTLLRGWQVYLLKGLVLYHARATCLHTFFNPEGQACGESIACGQYLQLNKFDTQLAKPEEATFKPQDTTLTQNRHTGKLTRPQRERV